MAPNLALAAYRRSVSQAISDWNENMISNSCQRHTTHMAFPKNLAKKYSASRLTTSLGNMPFTKKKKKKKNGVKSRQGDGL
jgi:hypothetical protein